MISRLNTLKDELTEVKNKLLFFMKRGYNHEPTNARYHYLLKEIEKESKL